VRKEKFDFPHTRNPVDPKSPDKVRAALRKEPRYSHENSILLTNYFFMREFLQAMAKEDGSLIVGGSNSYIAYRKPTLSLADCSLRLPSDLDAQTKLHPEQMLELIKDIISGEKDAKIILKDTEITTKSSLKTSIDVDMHGLLGKVYIDVVANEGLAHSQKKMNKIITTDEIFDVNVPDLEVSIAGKIESILNRISFAERNVGYRIKDFYDIYALCHDSDINRKLVNEYLSHKIDRNRRFRDSLRHAQDDMDTFVDATKDAQWTRFKRQNKVAPDADVDKIIGFGKNLIQDMEI